MGRRSVSRLVPLFLLLALAPPALAASGAWQLIDAADEALLRGEAPSAFRILRRAEAQARQSGDEALERRVLLGLADVRIAVSDLDKAARLLADLLSRAEEAKDREVRAGALVRLAEIDLRQARLARAAERFDAADGLHPAIAERIAIGRATLARLSGDMAEATARLAAVDEPALPPSLGYELRRERALGLTQRADYPEALVAWKDALSFARVRAMRGAEAESLVSMGELMVLLGLRQDAADLIETGRDLAHGVSDRLSEMRALGLLSDIRLALGDSDEAERMAELALGLARDGRDYLAEGRSMVRLAAFRGRHSIDLADRLLREAIQVFDDAGYGHDSFDARLRLTALHYAAGDQKRYGPLFRILGRAVIDPARKAGDEEIVWRALHLLARQKLAQGEIAAAVALFDEAVAILERIYRQTAGMDRALRSGFLADRRALYEDFVRALTMVDPGAVSGDPRQRAFQVSELARSRQFSEMVVAGGAERRAAGNDERLKALVDRSREVRLSLALARQRLRITADPAARAREVESMDRAEAELAALSDRIARDFPRFRALLEPEPLTVDAVREMLRGDEALVSYFMTAYRLVAFVFTRETFAVVPIAVRKKDLRERIERFREPLATVRGLSDLERWDPAVAAELHAIIVEPIAPLIGGAKTLYLVPDGLLYALPFEALLSAAPAPSESGVPIDRYGSLPWLGDRHAFAYVPSVGALVALRRGGAPKDRWQRALLAFADPDFGEGSGGGDAGLATKGLVGNMLARATGRHGLSRLPETADEARAVGRALGGAAEILLRADASEGRLYRENLESTRYVMFSTHGLLGGDFSAVAEPALALSMVGNPAELDGFLTMSEVLGLRMNADLVVLSACNTAGEPGAAEGGEGFAGLARSFMYAGTRSLLVSHWPVASKATVLLITAFFEELGAGHDKAEALRRAKARLRAAGGDLAYLAHPFFWAPFVVVGER